MALNASEWLIITYNGPPVKRHKKTKWISYHCNAVNKPIRLPLERTDLNSNTNSTLSSEHVFFCES